MNEKGLTNVRNYVSEKFSDLKNYLPDKKTLGLVGALTLGGAYNANAQDSQARENIIYSNNHEYSAACEGVTLKRFAEDLYLNVDSKINPDEQFQIYTKEGDLSWEVHDSKEVIQNVIKYLRSDLDSRDSQSKRERHACINFYENFLNEIPKSDEFTQRMLGVSLEDKIIDAEDYLVRDGNKRQWVIQDGVYSFIAKSPTIKDDDGNITHTSNTVPITTNVNLQAYEIVGDTIRSLKPYKTWSEDEKNQHAKDFAFFREGKELEEVSEGVYVSRKPKKAKEEIVEERKEETRVREDYDKPKRRTRFGLEASVGTHGEIGVGALLNIPVSKRISLEGYGNYFLRAGGFESSDSVTETTKRERQRVGPGTYKDRTDITTTYTEKKPVMEIGVRTTLNTGKVESFIGAGIVFVNGDETHEGKSIISHERNMKPLREPNIITNTMPGDSYLTTIPTFSVGALYEMGSRLKVGVSVNRTGDKNSGRVNVRGYINGK